MIPAEDTDDRGGAFAPTRAGVVERLRSRRSEIEEAIFVRVRDGVFDPAGSEDAEYVEGLRAAVMAVVDYGLTGIEQGEAFPMMVVPSVALAQARRAARAGVGLDTVMRRYVAGHALLEDFVIQETDDGAFMGRRTAVRRVLETSASLLDRLIPPITSAYLQEMMPVLRSSARRANSPTAPERCKQAGDRGRPQASSEQAALKQSIRIMQALVEVLAERGFAGATIGLVVRRARVSTRTFYQCFDSLEECLIAIMDTVLEEAVELVSRELQRADCWQDGLRSALAAMLSRFDREPGLARVCIVETLAGGPVVLAHRERLSQAFRAPVLQRIERDLPNVSPLAAEGVMGSVLGIMHAHMVTAKPGPLIELLGPLMGLIMAPHLGARGIEREIEQGDQVARAILAGDSRWSPQSSERDPEYGREQAAALPATGNPGARRARECLLFLAEHPGSSNREVAVGIHIAHQSHISRLLACLLQENLVTKHSEGSGKRNAWQLTARGEELAQALQ